MKLSVKIILLSVFLMLPLGLYAESEYKDPFVPLLPIEEVLPMKQGVGEEEGLYVVIEGVLWGTDTPQVIIDGEVYKVGDTLKNEEAKVFKIDKNTVFISRGEKIYKLKPKKASSDKRRGF